MVVLGTSNGVILTSCDGFHCKTVDIINSGKDGVYHYDFDYIKCDSCKYTFPSLGKIGFIIIKFKRKIVRFLWRY